MRFFKPQVKNRFASRPLESGQQDCVTRSPDEEKMSPHYQRQTTLSSIHVYPVTAHEKGNGAVRSSSTFQDYGHCWAPREPDDAMILSIVWSCVQVEVRKRTRGLRDKESITLKPRRVIFAPEHRKSYRRVRTSRYGRDEWLNDGLFSKSPLLMNG